jgi:hypothetical protein
VERRVLLEQRLVKSAAKDPDGDRWFGPGEKPKKAQHQDAQERMNNLMEGMVGEGSLMRQAIKDLTFGCAADNPAMMKEKEFGMISKNMKKLLDVKAKLVALSMDVNPHMRTISLCIMGSPYANFSAIPDRLHTGIPICIRRSPYAKLHIWGYKTKFPICAQLHYAYGE